MSVGRWRYLIFIPVIVFFFFSWQKSFTGDEGLTVYLASGSYSHLIDNVGADFHVPGYYSLLWLVSHSLGNSMLVLRLFSLFLILALIALSVKYLPFSAALFIGLSPFTLHLAVEIRMYAILALLGLILILAYRRFEKTQSSNSVILLILSLSACTWVHYFGWIGVAAVISLLLKNKKWKQAALVFFTVVILFSPWTPHIVSKVDLQSKAASVNDIGFTDETPLMQRLAGMPLSTGGSLLRFAGGTSVFNFHSWGLRSMSAYTLAGFFTGLLLFLLAANGFRKTDSISKSLILWVFIALGFFRPSARHYVMAYAAYMITAADGLPGKALVRRILILTTATLMVLLCFPFAAQSTIPQRCRWNRNFLQLAEQAVHQSEINSLPVVLFLDTYSYLGVRMHMDQLGFPDSLIWYPHRTSFESGRCFFEDRAECVDYLQCNSDSLVSIWLSLEESHRGFILVANNPEITTGPTLGSGNNTFIGLGSDIMADADLMDALNNKLVFQNIPLSGSQGPLNLFICFAKPDHEPL